MKNGTNGTTHSAPKIAGLRALVTGSNQGLGLEVARAFAASGASVMMCARNADKLAHAVEQARDAAIEGAVVRGVACDVSQPEDVSRLLAQTLEQLGGLDAVVANAGIYGPMGAVEENDWDAWKQCIEVNLYGTVLVCRAAAPHLKAQRRGRIVIVSGGGATRPMPGISAYSASKAGVLRFAETLAEELADWGITVNSVAPGALNTRLLDEVLSAGPAKVGEKFYQASRRQMESGGDSPRRAAELCLYLASEQSGSMTGRLISAKWDPWESLEQRATDLAGSDIYTLRRIVPADRGKDWGG